MVRSTLTFLFVEKLMPAKGLVLSESLTRRAAAAKGTGKGTVTNANENEVRVFIP